MKIIKATKLVSEINKKLQKTINETTKEENKLIYINRILLVIFDTINKINSLKEKKKDRTKNILKYIDNFEIIGLSFSTLLAITNTFAIEIVAISELTFFLLTFTTKSIIKINSKLTNKILDKNIDNLYKLMKQCKEENDKLLPNKINKKEITPQTKINTIKYTNNGNLVKRLKK